MVSSAPPPPDYYADAAVVAFRTPDGDVTITELNPKVSMGRYSESHESGRALIADGMAVKRTADVPMSAMSARRAQRGAARIAADIRESASVAHIYGQNIVAAESLTAATGAFSYTPETLKPTADVELSQGLSRSTPTQRSASIVPIRSCCLQGS